jgi:hypothetical protein
MVISSPSSSAVIAGGRRIALAARARFAKTPSLLRVIVNMLKRRREEETREKYDVW